MYRNIRAPVADCTKMSAALADRYSSLSFQDCLCSLGERETDRAEAAADPLVDLPLTDNHHRSFAVPPGIQVCYSK